MRLTFDERLNQILPRLTSREFLDSKGLGNEIGFWIFDYPPDRELDMRSFLSGTVLPALTKQVPALRADTIDLLQLVTGLLDERKLLDKAMDMQLSKGDDSTLAALRSVLKEDKIAQKIIEDVFNPMCLSATEVSLIKHVRELSGDRPGSPIVLGGKGVIALVAV